MAYAGTAVVRNRLLWLSGSATDIQIDTPAWFRWLQTATSFSYPLGRPTYYSLTLRQEKRRRRLYWYAYLKSGCLLGAKLHNSYVGVSATLTAEKLDTVAKHLLDKVRQTLANHYQQGGETLH
jgi:hypothetical protein